MTVKRRGSARAALGSALFAVAVALAMPAQAETRVTSFATFLHIGPGRQFAVTDELPTRTTVEVAGCENDWCQIRYGAASGWIDQHMLAAPPRPANASPAECFDFARTGWPNTGDHDRLCIQAPLSPTISRP